MEHIQQTFKGTCGSGARVVATVSRNGDLIHDCFLKIIANGEEVENPGHYILDNVEVEIGGQVIDRQYGHFMEAHAQLTEPSYGGYANNDDDEIYIGDPFSSLSHSAFQLMAGAGGIDIDVNSNLNLHVPLRFWFCRHVGLSLPLIALQYHEVNINVTFTAAYSDITNIEPQLWVNYIYLDTDERRRFAQVSHEYLIEQVQTQEFSWAYNDNTNQTFKLNFNHPVKELIWAATRGEEHYDDGNYHINWGANFTDNIYGGGFAFFANGINSTMKLKLNGHDRFSEQCVDYFTRYQPYKYHKNLCRSYTTDTIGVYSFALKPEEHQPSGTCNFSRIDSALFELTNPSQFELEDERPNSTTLQMYAINYNVLRIMSGMGGLAYSN